ncbi:MAG: hypothetical protein V3W41_11025 [Planctomycetota bacterium]
MKTLSISLVVMIAALIAIPSCVSGEPDPGYDNAGPAGHGVVPTGSSHLQPADGWQELPDPRTPLFKPKVARYPEVPTSRLASLRRNMTESELLDIMGPPLEKSVRQHSTDTGRDWNAWVWHWRYQDSRFSDAPLARDFEARLAFIDSRDTAVGRTNIQGPVWILTGWDLH